MSVSIAARKKARAQRKTSLRQKAQEKKSNTSYKDDRFWRCERDSTGKGDAVIRFLPPTDEMVDWYVEKFEYDAAEVPFYINYHKHAFKGANGKWFIENCPTSIVERECPVCEANGALVDGWGGWDAVDDNHSEKKLVRQRKRKETYIANILVVKDTTNPDNEGKVMIFEYGKAIHDHVMGQLIPEFEDEEECDVSDYWDGRNFKLRIVQKDGYANYDKSTWEAPSMVSDLDEDDDEGIQAIMDQQHNLTAIVGDDKYKSYDDLTKQFARVNGKEAPRRKSVTDDSGDDSDGAGDQSDAPEAEEKSRSRTQRRPRPEAEKPAKVEEKKPAKKETAPAEESAGGDPADDDAYFASLLND